jgi:hypothetical protein
MSIDKKIIIQVLADLDTNIKNLLANIRPAEHCQGALGSITESVNNSIEQLKIAMLQDLEIDKAGLCNIDEYTPAVMKLLAIHLKNIIPDNVGFSLLIFEFGEGIREFKYVSNAQRVNLIATYEQLVARWKIELS